MGKMTFRMVVNPQDDYPFIAIDEFQDIKTTDRAIFSSYYTFLIATHDTVKKREYEGGSERIYTKGSKDGTMIKLDDDTYERLSIEEYIKLSDVLKRIGQRFNKKKGEFKYDTVNIE